MRNQRLQQEVVQLRVDHGQLQQVFNALPRNNAAPIPTTRFPEPLYQSPWLPVPAANQSYPVIHNLNKKEFLLVSVIFSDKNDSNGRVFYLDAVTSSGTGIYGLEIMCDEPNQITLKSWGNGSSWSHALGVFPPYCKVRLW